MIRRWLAVKQTLDIAHDAALAAKIDAHAAAMMDSVPPFTGTPN